MITKETKDILMSDYPLFEENTRKFFKKDNIMYMNLEIDSREYLICI